MTEANTTHVTETSDTTKSTRSDALYHSLPYYPNVLLDRFAPYSQQPWAMLLHSVFADHHHNRLDIMVADP
ncbi:aminodeoxychorismate synthase component I, partial [Pectobacterium brasiliense]|nr:aminodeoxychorismate synthase component I [Pectobacterium brasiliense]